MKPANGALRIAERKVLRSCIALAAMVGTAMAGALAPQETLAQTGTTYSYPIKVEFQDGQWSKSLPGSRQWPNTTIYILVSHPPVICGVHTLAGVETRIGDLIKAGTLKSKLDEFEAAGKSSSSELAGALANLMGGSGFITDPKYTIAPFEAGASKEIMLTGTPLINVLAGISYDIKKDNCLTFADATTWAFELRKVIRAYLSLPPP